MVESNNCWCIVADHATGHFLAQFVLSENLDPDYKPTQGVHRAWPKRAKKRPKMRAKCAISDFFKNFLLLTHASGKIHDSLPLSRSPWPIWATVYYWTKFFWPLHVWNPGVLFSSMLDHAKTYKSMQLKHTCCDFQQNRLILKNSTQRWFWLLIYGNQTKIHWVRGVWRKTA